jgi:hypothetical protein
LRNRRVRSGGGHNRGDGCRGEQERSDKRHRPAAPWSKRRKWLGLGWIRHWNLLTLSPRYLRIRAQLQKCATSHGRLCEKSQPYCAEARPRRPSLPCKMRR